MSDLGFWQFAEKNPDVLALVDPDGREWTRGQLHAECNKISNKLHDMGLRRNDVVACMLPNSAEFLAVYLACAQSGYCMMPVDWHLTGAEVANILKDSAARAFFACANETDIAKASQKAVTESGFPDGRICIGGALEGFQPYARFLEGASTEAPAQCSTGKVTVYSVYGILPEDRNVHLCGTPLYHTTVLVYAQAALHMGHAVVIMDKWQAEEMLALIDKYQVTTSYMMPTQFDRLLQLPAKIREQYDCASTRAMIYAAPCPPHIKQQMLAWWGNTIYEVDNVSYLNDEGSLLLCDRIGKAENVRFN